MSRRAPPKSTKPARNEYQRKKEEEEARKAGTLAPEVDVVTGKLLNPHLPAYVAKTPWFYGVDEGSTLIHQHNLKEQKVLDETHAKYTKGFTGVAKSYRKGACENCGAMTHKKKDCFYRPRKKSAKQTEQDIMPDEIIADELKLDYDGKRDRWVGYDPADHLKVVAEFEAVDQMRREKKAKELMEEMEAKGKTIDEIGADLGDPDLKEELIEDGSQAQVGQKFDSKTRMTVRNLRIREDTAKYLFNLDPNSAFYDPKSRSMREDPLPDVDPSQKPFAGDGFVRSTGDAQELNVIRQFALHAQETGNQDVHHLAAPSATELQYKKHMQQLAEQEKNKMKNVLERYGGEEHLLSDAQPQKELLMGQTEVYREFAADGRQLLGPKSVARSRYPEDVMEGNHTQVWGSYWEDFKWGFACCHQFVRNSVCTGEKGIEIKREQDNLAILKPDSDHSPDSKPSKKKKKKKKKKGKKSKKKQKRLLTTETGVSEKEMEEYRKKRARREDPMAQQ